MTGTVLAAGSDQAGPLGLLVIVLLGIAVYFLGRSLAKHLRRVPPSFDPPPDAGGDGRPDAAAGSDASGNAVTGTGPARDEPGG